MSSDHRPMFTHHAGKVQPSCSCGWMSPKFSDEGQAIELHSSHAESCRLKALKAHFDCRRGA